MHRPAVTRRLHLELGVGGGLQVVAPRRMSRRSIQSALQQRSGHVERFVVRARERRGELPVFTYGDGELHPFMGRKYPLNVRCLPNASPLVELTGENIEIRSANAGPDQVRERLTGWYRQCAQTHFSERLAAISRRASWTGGKTPVMRLRRMKRTWGNCTAMGLITLNPHLVKAPPECIDYVIAHEICHLREHNHGKAFYALQAQLFPTWRESRAHLRDKGHIYLHQ